MLAVHDGQVGGHIDRIGVVLVHADGEVILRVCALRQGQGDGFAVLLQQAEVDHIQVAAAQGVPVGVRHAGGLVVLELQAHGQDEGVVQEVFIIQGQVHAAGRMAQVVRDLALGAVAARGPHMDLEVGGADQLIAVQGLLGDLIGGVLIGADGHIQQVQVGAVGVEAGQVSPHELGARGAGVAGHLQHPVGHHLGHLHDGVHTDALVGGVPPAFVAGDDGAEGAHLVLVVAGQGAAGGAHGVGDAQQVSGAAELLGVELDGRLIAGVLECGQGVVVSQIQGRGVKGGGGARCALSGLQREALILTGVDHGLGRGVIILLGGMDAADDQGDAQALSTLVIEGELRGILMADRAHGGDGQVGGAVVGVAQQLRGDTHILADIGLALHAVLEEQVGNARGGILQLQAVGERLGQEVHPPDHCVLAVHGHGVLHGHVGVDLQGQGFLVLVLGQLDLLGSAGSGGQPAALCGGLLHLVAEGLYFGLTGRSDVQNEDGPGGDLGGAAVHDVLQGGVALAQGDARASLHQGEVLAQVLGEIHGEVGRPGSGVAHHHGEPGVGGIGRDGGLLTVQGLIGPVVIEAGSAVIRNIDVVQCFVRTRVFGASVLIAAHDDADAAVKLHAGVLKGLGREEGGQGGAAVILDARTVQPAVLHIGGVVCAGIQLAVIIHPVFEISIWIIGSSGGIQVAQSHDHLRGIGVADLHIDVLVILALNNLQAQGLAQLLDPGQLGHLAVILVVIGFAVDYLKGVNLLYTSDSRTIGDRVIAGALGQSPHQGVGVLVLVRAHILDLARKSVHRRVDLFAFCVGDGELIGHAGLEGLLLLFLVAARDILAVHLDAGVVDQRPQGGVALILVYVNDFSGLFVCSGILQRVPLGVPLKAQGEQATLMLDGLDNAVGGAGRHSQAVAQLIRIDRLMVGSGNQFNGFSPAENVGQPLGIFRNADSVGSGIQLMIALSAAVDQTVHRDAVMGRLTRLFVFAPPDSGILDYSNTVFRDLTSLDLLAQIGRHVLNQAAAHGDVEALFTAADSQHGYIQVNGVLHEVQVRGITGIIPAGRAVGIRFFVIKVGVPILASGHKHAVDTGEDVLRLFVGLHLGQEDDLGAVALEGLGEALIISSYAILFPGDADDGALPDVGDLDGGDLIAGDGQVGHHGVAQGAVLMGRAGEFLRRCIRLAQNGIQLVQRVDGAALGRVCHRDAVGDLGFIHHIVFQVAVRVHGIQDRVRYRLRGLRGLVLCRFNC